MFHWYRWLDETHSAQGSKPKCRFAIWLHSICRLRRPPNSHSLVIVLSSYFRFQVSTNHMVDEMASSLVENKLDSVKASPGADQSQ